RPLLLQLVLRRVRGVRRVLVAGLEDAQQAGVLVLLAFPRRERLAPLEEAQVVEEELAVEMVELVLEADGEQLAAFDLDRFAVPVERADLHPRRTLDPTEDLG